MTFSTGFAPLADGGATVLILGSMPGRASLDAEQYYAHPRNAFWPLMQALFGIPPGDPYAQRMATLAQRRVALWDVLRECRRPGSLDSSIDSASVVVNDFPSFFAANPALQRVFFNGAKAEQEYRRRVLPQLPAQWSALELRRLPSTSPALASLSFEQKLAQWRCVAA